MIRHSGRREAALPESIITEMAELALSSTCNNRGYGFRLGPSGRPGMTLMYLRLLDPLRPGEKIEVAALVGLADVL